MRIIGHLDMDAFFAAIEERDHPELKGRPLVVGADPAGDLGRGVVSTANYPARAYGIHSAMPISTAWRLAEAARRRGRPATVFVPGSHRKYGQVSARIMAILHQFAPVVEGAGIDEAYFDLSFTGSYDRAADLARQIKAAILAQERLTASIGIGPNKMVAKIASDFQKPDGLTVVTAAEAEDFLAPLAVRKIPGIGPKTEQSLALPPKLLPQLLHSHPDEADKFASGVFPAVQEGHQEFHGFKGQQPPRGRGRRPGVGAGAGLEVGEAHRDHHGAVSVKTPGGKAPVHLPAQLPEAGEDELQVPGVLGKGLLLPHGFGLPRGHQGAVVAAPDALIERRTPLAEPFPEFLRRKPL